MDVEGRTSNVNLGHNEQTTINIPEVRSTASDNGSTEQKRNILGWIVCEWKQIAQVLSDERRRLTHSFKVGLALSLVSLLLLYEESYDELGDNAIWAVMTVVVIFEYTAGATLSKGLNRGFGTIVAAILGLMVSFVANKSGPDVGPYLIGTTVFILGSSATFFRFLPRIKAKFDYGVVIFILTYCLVVVSGSRVPHSLNLVLDRLKTVFIGAAICLAISLFLFPIWAGEDLHLTILNNFDLLAASLEECVKLYFQRVPSTASKAASNGITDDERIRKSYKKILDSKQAEESMATFARWEPRHGNILSCRSYPWKRYVEVGEVLRHCAYSVSSLHGCLQSDIQASDSLRLVFSNSCTALAKEINAVIAKLGSDLKKKQCSMPKELLLKKLNAKLACLHTLLDTHLNLFGGSIVNGASQFNESISRYEVAMSTTTINNNPVETRVRRYSYDDELLHDDDDDDVTNSITSDNSRMKARLRKSASMNDDDSHANSNYDRVPVMLGQYMNSSRFSKSFPEVLSVTTVVFLLLELSSRLEHLVDVVKQLQEEAGFKEEASTWLQNDDNDNDNGDDDVLDNEQVRRRNESFASENEKNERRRQDHLSTVQITE